jgi:predicted RNA-binding protein YlxR (DUF448 family)
MAIVRRCLGCNSVDTTENLLRCVVKNNRVVVDEQGREQGRGAWVHPRTKCLDQSLSRRAWSRSLKQGPGLDCSAVEELSRSTDLETNRLNG